MVAVSVDPEDQIVPLAFALAEGENNESWSWFMRLLRVHVLGKSRRVCLISDRHRGILNAAEEDIIGFPRLEHRWCMRHFAANFWRRQKKNEVLEKLKALCCARAVHTFDERKKELDKILNEEAKKWLDDQMQQKSKWALAFDDGGWRYGIMTTNSSESFNNVFRGIRSLPVSGIVEFSFLKCNEYFVNRWGLANRLIHSDGPWGKAGREHLAEAELWSKRQVCTAFGPERMIYDVQSAGGTSTGGERYGGRTYRVDLKKIECTCNIPQLMHAPCSHTITACKTRGLDFLGSDFMSPYYKRENTLKVWETPFEPYRDPTQWPEYKGYDYWPDPDLLKVGKGRRKKKRLRGDMDAVKGYGADMYGTGDFDATASKNLCSGCHKPGHKASTCPRKKAKKKTTKGPNRSSRNAEGGTNN